jgi:putative DNA primase/helicase
MGMERGKLLTPPTATSPMRGAAPVETFTATHVDRHPTELADLRGARLVTATETPPLGREPHQDAHRRRQRKGALARFMRQDLFEFAPQSSS